MFGNAPSPLGRKTVLATLAGVALIASFLLGGLPAAQAQGGIAAPAAAVGTSFNSSFNGGHGGWSIVYGPWVQGTAEFTTVGKAGYFSSIIHSDTYHNFVYTAKMRRTSSNDHAGSGLIIRGSSSSLTADKQWANAYYFNYTNASEVVITKIAGGVATGLDYTISPAVNAGGWNTLKVVAYDDVMLFYVNGTRIFTLDDPTWALGSVGISMYRSVGSTSNKLRVDWAKLQVINY